MYYGIKRTLITAAILFVAAPWSGALSQEYAVANETISTGYTAASSNEFAAVARMGAPLVVKAASNDFGLDPLLIEEEYPTGDDAGSIPPAANFLANCYPNPFNPSTRIEYRIAERSAVSLKVFDVSGRLVRTLVDDVRDAGHYRLSWDGRNNSGRAVSSGIYFISLRSKEFRQTRKIVLLR